MWFFFIFIFLIMIFFLIFKMKQRETELLFLWLGGQNKIIPSQEEAFFSIGELPPRDPCLRPFLLWLHTGRVSWPQGHAEGVSLNRRESVATGQPVGKYRCLGF